MFPATTLEVDVACSGVGSLISFIAMAVAYACFIKTTIFKRWLTVVSAILIAMFTSTLRVVMTGILAQYLGEKAAKRL